MDEGGSVDVALALAHGLAAARPEFAMAHRVVGDLRYAAAIHVAGGDTSEEFRKADAALHLRFYRDALSAAKRLAPDCVDIATALGEASKMFGPAESEFRCAQSIFCPVDPTANNAAYDYGEETETTPPERVEAAWERARRSYARMTVEELVPLAVERVLDVANQHGATEELKEGNRVPESFPNLARAQYLNAYMDLEFVRGLDASIDRRAFLRRTLTVAEREAQAFPGSAVIALFALDEYDATERECRRAVDMKLMEPDDPHHDCIRPGSISGENRGVRLVSLACEFHELLHMILMLARDYWDSMSSERQQSFLSVRLDVLQDEYNMVDLSCAFTMSDVQSFVKEKGSWRFWDCPICDSKKFLDTGLLLSVLLSLQSVLDPKISEKALVGDDSLDGVSICQDSDQKDMISFDKMSDIFKWLFYAPSSGVGAKPLPEIQETKRQNRNMLLESIKEKMKILPADKSIPEFIAALPEINDLWHKVLRTSVLDYRAMDVTLARSFPWKELTKCMSQDLKEAAKFISATDIDAIFTKGVDTDGGLKITESHDGSEVLATESSKTAVNGTKLSDPPINVTESGNDLDTEMKNLQIDPISDDPITTSEASSSDPNGQQV